jgi:hypothetical protein
VAEDFKGSGHSAAVGEPEAPRRGGGLPLPALKYWRKRRELSQTELARRANLRIEYVFRVENVRRGCNPETAQLLADLLESGYARGYMHNACSGHRRGRGGRGDGAGRRPRMRPPENPA